MHHRHLVLRGSLVIAVVLLISLGHAPPAGAQSSCRFVLGFAELVVTLGPSVVGTCLEEQRTITGSETFDLGGTRLTLPPGTAVQRTTNGILTWSPAANRAAFRDAWGERYVGPDGAFVARSWDDIVAQAVGSAPVAPVAPASTGQPSSQSRCAALALELTADVPRSRTERLAATWGSDDVTAAAESLCLEAAEDHGARGVTCFETAFAIARGRERLFPGQGASAYQGAYARCIAGR